MLIVYVVIWSAAVLLGLSAVWALVWAVRTGQFHGLRQSAESIFDASEPLGVVTDRFPDGRRHPASAASPAKEDRWQR